MHQIILIQANLNYSRFEAIITNRGKESLIFGIKPVNVQLFFFTVNPTMIYVHIYDLHAINDD